MKLAGRLSLVLAAVLGAPACAGPAQQAAGQCQVIVGFAEPTDAAAPATLAALAKASGTGVAFVSAISPRSAAYRLDSPADDPACGRAIAALQAHPSIRYLNLDQKRDFR